MATLYVVATPIGNLSDMTPRAVQALGDCALIAAEDTRVTRKLLTHFDIHTPLISYHRHNERARAQEIIARMGSEGMDVAITCDAGTPAISDPGFVLVDLAHEAGIPVVPICGASAVTAALSACGFDAREFAFYGFLPREKKQLLQKLDAIHNSGIPIAVLYESPHRVVSLMQAVCARFPGAQVAVLCDISKYYEKIERGDPAQVLSRLEANPNVHKGEYCVVLDISAVPPPVQSAQPLMECEAALFMHMLQGAPLAKAQAEVAREGYPRNRVYKAALRIKQWLEDGWEE